LEDDQIATEVTQATAFHHALLGVEFPVGPHVVLEPYYLRQNSSRSNPPHINVFGFKFNVYL